MLALLLSLAAFAGDWSEPRPYAVPRLSANYIQVNGVGAAQLVGGGEVGVILRDRDIPHWLSLSRFSAVGLYGLGTNSLGGDLRVGSFIGPDGRFARFLTGPDVWYNGYGTPEALDYHLPWSPGVDLRNTVLLKLSEPFKIAGQVTPGWVFSSKRQTAIEDLVVIHELTASAVAMLQTEGFSFTLGVQRSWNAAGVTNSVILGAGL